MSTHYEAYRVLANDRLEIRREAAEVERLVRRSKRTRAGPDGRTMKDDALVIDSQGMWTGWRKIMAGIWTLLKGRFRSVRAWR